MKLFPNDVLGIKPNDILDGKNRKRKDRYNKVQKQVDEAIDSLLEVSQEYYVTWSGPDQVPTYISISEESEEEAARVLVDNTSFLTQSMPLHGSKTRREVEDFIDEIDATDREVKLIHAPSVLREFTTY